MDDTRISVADLPQGLVDELARGITDPEIVASWYGMGPEQWKAVSKWPPLLKAVESRRAEFDRDGLTVQLKARIMHGATLDKLFKLVMSPDASFRAAMEFAQHTAEIGDVKPKKEMAQQGSGFSVVINLGDVAKPSVTIEQVDPLDAPPAYLKLVPEAVLDVVVNG